jgi:hypothetical protein
MSYFILWKRNETKRNVYEYLYLHSSFLEQAKDQNSLDSIKSLVYWYGYFDELKEAYSFVYPSKLMTYETGMNRIERKVSFLNKRKKEGKAVVPLFDQGLLKGMEEMKEDLKKMPSKRCGYVGRYWEEDNDSDYDNEEDYNDEQGDGVNNSGDEEEYNDEQDDGVNYSGDDEEEYNDEEDDVRIQGTSGKRKRGGGTEVHVKEGTRRSPKKKKETALLKEQNKKHHEEIVTLKAKNKKAAQALRNSAQMLLNAAHALEAANLSYIV